MEGFTLRKTIAKVLLAFCLLFVISPIAIAANLGDKELGQGSVGDDVAQLQQLLNSMGYWTGNVDGIFGESTTNALINLQRDKGITADGIVGSETLRALNVNTPSSYRGSTGRYSERDIELLARLVHAEAKGESYTGKVAVAATVLNRLEDPNYPGTISEVIYQIIDGCYQYSPVLDGQINMPADEESRMAALDALAGSDPTGSALVFYNPSKTNDQWVRSRQYITTIGSHVFSR